MTERPKLRVVADDERHVPDGSIKTVIEDLEVAAGHVVEAQAEAAECPGDVVELVDALMVADAAVTKALRTARQAQR